MILNQIGSSCYGGQTGDPLNPSNFDGETWAYDSTANKWMMMQPVNAPTPRSAPALAYDTESDRIILFGGFRVATGTVFNDTWPYDYNTNTWTVMKPSVSPPGRNVCGMTYDSESDRITLFGGYTEELDPTVWAYDYNSDTWQQMTTASDVGPGFRDAVKIAYDSQADRVILYGGAPVTWEGYDQTWSYDYNSNTWTDLQPTVNPWRRR